jgi:MFS family permease
MIGERIRETGMFQFAIVLALMAICAYVSGHIAERRGRSVKLWIWLGALFGPLALVVALLPPRRRRLAH